jgi:hypothetical protein
VFADQEIEIDGQTVNIHDLRAIVLDGYGRIVDYLQETPDGLLRTQPATPPIIDVVRLAGKQEALDDE